MMKKILLLAFCLISLVGFGQGLRPSGTLNLLSSPSIYRRWADSTLYLYSGNYWERLLTRRDSINPSPITIVNGNNLISTKFNSTASGVTHNSNYANSFVIGDHAAYQAGQLLNSNVFGYQAAYQNPYLSNVNDFGYQAGYKANANSNNFGYQAGYKATYAPESNNWGTQAGYEATNAQGSNFGGNLAGYQAANAYFSNFWGSQTGFQAVGASYSNFSGYSTGFKAANASYSTLSGYRVGSTFTGNNLGSNNIIIGTNISLLNASANAINLGGVLFAKNTYSTTTGNPSIAATATGSVGVGVVPGDITARLQLPAATGAAGSGSLKLPIGTPLGTPEDGLFEYIPIGGTNHVTFTIGSTRKILDPTGGIILRTVGVSGASTLNGDTLNIPVYGGSGGGINLTDLHADSPITYDSSNGHIGHDTIDGGHHVPATSTTNLDKVLTSGAHPGALYWKTPSYMVYPSTAGIVKFDGSGWTTSLTDSSYYWGSGSRALFKWDGSALANGGTQAQGRSSLGGTIVGQSFFTLANGSTIRFPRINADNSVDGLSAADFRTAIGAGTSSTGGTIDSIMTEGAITGGTITTRGTIGHMTTDGYHHVPATGIVNDKKVLQAQAGPESEQWVKLTTNDVDEGNQHLYYLNSRVEADTVVVNTKNMRHNPITLANANVGLSLSGNQVLGLTSNYLLPKRADTTRWSAGNVSSVALSMPNTFFTVVNSPIHTSGTLSVFMNIGRYIPTVTDTTRWGSKQGVITSGAITDYYRGDKSWAPFTTAVENDTVVINTKAKRHNAVTLNGGSASGLTLTNQALAVDTQFVAKKTTIASMYQPKGSYQTALTNPNTGLGTANYLPKYTGTGSVTTIGNSQIFDNGTNVGLGTVSAKSKFQVRDGNMALYNNIGTNNLGAQIYLGSTGFDDVSYHNSAPGIGSIYNSNTSSCGDLGLYVYNNAVNSRSESIRLLYNGNIGVNTPNALRKIAIRGSGTDNGFIEFHKSSHDVPYVGFGYDEALDGLAFKYNNGSSDFNGTSMFINRSGNIGMGTTSLTTDYKLEVNGKGLFRVINPGTETTPIQIVNLSNTDGSAATIGLTVYSDNGLQTGNLTNTRVASGSYMTSLGAYGNTRVLNVFSDKVGIGNYAPLAPFHVSANYSIFANSDLTGTVGSGMIIGQNGTSGAVTTFLRTFKNGTGDLTGNFAMQPSGGTVSIGKLTATSKLDIAAGTTTNAPFGIDAGPLLTTPVPNKIENNGNHLYYTRATGTRVALDSTGTGGLNISVQALSGTSPTWDIRTGTGATLTLTGNTVVSLAGFLTAGSSGMFRIVSNPSSDFSLTMTGYTSIMFADAYGGGTNRLKTNYTSGSSILTVYHWWYDGFAIYWEAWGNTVYTLT